nr:ATP-binding protein [Anaerolineae bacterium]
MPDRPRWMPLLAALRRPRSPLPVFLLALALWLLNSLLLSLVLLQLPGSPTRQLALALSGTGILTTVTSYAFYRIGLLHWFGSLRWSLLLMTLFTTAQILLNMAILAWLMFVDSQFITLTGVIVVYVALTAIAFGFFLSQAITDRLSRIAEGAGRLAAGDLTTRLSVPGNDEITRLAEAFNAMARALEAADERQRHLEKNRRDLVAWVSHDLRTPLTSMRVMLEALADGVIRDEDTFQRYLHTSLGEIRHLSHLIDDLFEMARLDVGHVPLERQPVSVPDLLSDTLSSMSARAGQRGLTLRGSVQDGVDIIHAAPDKLQRVLSNLVSNAISYTPAGETVTLAAGPGPQPGMVSLSVHNSGVQIAPEVLPRLFESFYRGDAARARTDDGRGTGLGLAIARGLVEAHGGRLHARSDATGTTFI